MTIAFGKDVEVNGRETGGRREVMGQDDREEEGRIGSSPDENGRGKREGRPGQETGEGKRKSGDQGNGENRGSSWNRGWETRRRGRGRFVEGKGGELGEEDDRRRWRGYSGVVAMLDSSGGGARAAAAAGTTSVVSAWPGQGVAAVVAAAAARRRAAAAATAVGLLPRPSVSSHSRWRRLPSFFSQMTARVCGGVPSPLIEPIMGREEKGPT